MRNARPEVDLLVGGKALVTFHFEVLVSEQKLVRFRLSLDLVEGCIGSALLLSLGEK